MEIELGRLAEVTGASPRVKEFGATSIIDHTKLQMLLNEVAARNNMTISLVPNDSMQAQISQFAAYKGPAFDRQYISFMIQVHEQELERFYKEATVGKNPEIKAFVAGQLEMLQQHLNMAKAILKVVSN